MSLDFIETEVEIFLHFYISLNNDIDDILYNYFVNFHKPHCFNLNVCFSNPQGMVMSPPTSRKTG